MLSPKRLLSASLTWTRRLFIPVAMGFLVYSAYGSVGHLRPLIANLSFSRMVEAWVCWCIAQWISPLTTVAIARIRALPLDYRDLFLISALRIPSKYLPGGIWQSVARFVAYTQIQVKKADSLTILITEHLFALGVSAGMGGLLLWHSERLQQLHGTAIWVSVSALCILIVASMLAVKGRKASTRALPEILMLIVATVLFWIFAAASFCAYWGAIFGLHPTEIPEIAACYLLSWAAGFIAPFAPQGLGVFEWVASHLLPPTQSLGATVAMVAGFRLVTIAADLCVWMVALAYARRLKAQPR